jgi:hypothetical protein
VSTDKDAFCVQYKFNAAAVCRVPIITLNLTLFMPNGHSVHSDANVAGARSEVNFAASLHSKRNFRDCYRNFGVQEHITVNFWCPKMLSLTQGRPGRPPLAPVPPLLSTSDSNGRCNFRNFEVSQQ